MIKSQPCRNLMPTALVAATLAVVTTACGDYVPSPEVIAQEVISECQDAVKTLLKDPGSARFDGWKSWEVTNHSKTPPVEYHPDQGDKLWSAGGEVNAKNGFGGYVGDQAYGCDAAVTTDARVRAHAYSIDDMLTAPDDAPGGGS